VANKLGNSNSINGLCSIQGRLNEGENHVERTTWENLLHFTSLNYQVITGLITFVLRTTSGKDFKGELLT